MTRLPPAARVMRVPRAARGRQRQDSVAQSSCHPGSPVRSDPIRRRMSSRSSLPGREVQTDARGVEAENREQRNIAPVRPSLVRLAERATLPATDHGGIRRVAFPANESASPGLNEERLDVRCHSAVPATPTRLGPADRRGVIVLHGSPLPCKTGVSRTVSRKSLAQRKQAPSTLYKQFVRRSWAPQPRFGCYCPASPH